MRHALLKTLAFHRVLNHAPTLAEWLATLEWKGTSLPAREDAVFGIEALKREGAVIASRGRYIFSGEKEAIERQRENELWLARKLRAAQNVTRWLARLSSVRFVALCNSTALGHAQNEGDLDFFVITHAGAIMLTRGLAALPWILLRRRPGDRPEIRDPVCLSYFVADDVLDLNGHMLTPEDPYFRYWFLSLLPLLDDGVGAELWRANAKIIARHPFSEMWQASPDLRIAIPRLRLPMPRMLEAPASRFQTKYLPISIRTLMNRDTRVMITPQALKLHVTDRRAEYRDEHVKKCAALGICD